MFVVRQKKADNNYCLVYSDSFVFGLSSFVLDLYKYVQIIYHIEFLLM
jgi:hypothetical protein